MSFVALIIKNLVRQRIRSGLTILGISMGITTVVALGVVTSSLKESAGEIIRMGDADFMVAQEGAADLTFSLVSEEDAASLAAYQGVARADGVLFHVVHVGSNPFFFMMGRDVADLAVGEAAHHHAVGGDADVLQRSGGVAVLALVGDRGGSGELGGAVQPGAAVGGDAVEGKG